MTKAKGNMYDFITHTHNVIKGKCTHACFYCYMNKLYKKGWLAPNPPYFNEMAVRKNLGKGHYFFIGSSCDMWADNIPQEWIDKALIQTNRYEENKYLFQTKNPRRFNEFSEHLHGRTIGATIETNRRYNCMGATPVPRLRVLPKIYGAERFITIEPILDFDIDIFVEMLKDMELNFINIGADSTSNNLPEPEPEKIRELIKELEKFTEVRLKKNLKRLLPEIK